MRKKQKCLNPKSVYKYDSRTNTYFVNINIKDYDDIFNKWDYSPYDKKDLNPELDNYLKSCLQEIPAATNLDIRFFLPRTIYQPLVEEQCRESLQYYFDYRKSLLSFNKKNSRKDTLQYSIYGIGLIITAYFVQKELTSFKFLSFITEGFFIGAWVLLWEVFSYFFFTRKDMQRDRLTYQRLNKANYEFIYE